MAKRIMGHGSVAAGAQCSRLDHVLGRYPGLAEMFLEREALGWSAAEAELHLRRRIEPAVGEIAARLGTRARGKRRLEEFRRQLDDVVERLAPFVARLLRRRDLGQRDTGLRRKPLHRLVEG